MKSCKFNS